MEDNGLAENIRLTGKQTKHSLEWHQNIWLFKEIQKMHSQSDYQITLMICIKITICEKLIDNTPITLTKENNILLQLASHACKRDEKALVASTWHILAEIETITNLNVTVKEYEPKMSDYFPHIETKEEVETKQLRSLNKSFNILIKLLSIPNMTTATPSQETTW